jgi:Rrf2 family protein
MRNSLLTQRSLLLSVTADYALRAILLLARESTRPMRAHEIADAIGAPRNYTSKTLNSLAKAGLLTSLRGPAGGFVLAASPATLTVARIAAVFDAPESAARCLLRDQMCDPTNPCVAHERWADVPRAARQALATTTIASLLGAPADTV